MNDFTMTKETEIEHLMQLNRNLLFILGAASLLIERALCETEHEKLCKQWIFEAIDAVVYHQEPLPEFPT